MHHTEDPRCGDVTQRIRALTSCMPSSSTNPAHHRRHRGDVVLLERWVAGNRRAGGALVRRHFTALERFFTNRVPEGDRADLIQATLLECTRAVERFRGEARFKTYLLAIARNVLLHYYRTRARKLDHVDPLTHSVADCLGGDAFVQLAQVDDRHALLQALSRLPLEQQMVLELRYFERLTLEECAVVLERSPSVVSRRIDHAKRLLREALGA